MTDFKFDKWIKIDEQRENFYRFHFEGDDDKVTPIRLKGLDFLKIKTIVASPFFGMDNNYQVAYMDSEGVVFLTEVEIVYGEFNEGLTLSPFSPSTKLIDMYGAENMETLG